MRIARRIGTLAIATFLCAACGAIGPSSQSSRSVDTAPADQTSVRFIVEPPPAGILYDLQLAKGGDVGALWRGPCASGQPAGCTRGVALRSRWSKERVGQLLAATAQAGFPKLVPSPSGGFKATPSTSGGWALEITTVDGGEQWIGKASGTTSQSDPYASIWGPRAFPPVSSAAGATQSAQPAAEIALRTVGAPTPYALLGAQSVQWPDSCLGLPSPGTCRAGAIDGWLFTFRAGDDSWWWVRTDKTAQRAVVDDGSRPVLCGSSGAGCAPPAPTCQACPPAPGSASASSALPFSENRGRD